MFFFFFNFVFQIEYPEIEDNIKPKHRVMSSFEQVGVTSPYLCVS